MTNLTICYHHVCAGKTTLLNTLACRLDRNQVTHAQVKLNGKDYSSAQLKRMAGYVMQDDLLNADLNVEETLRYTARLRLPPTVAKEEREERITKVSALPLLGILATGLP